MSRLNEMQSRSPPRNCNLSSRVNYGKQAIIEDIRFFELDHGDVIRDDATLCKRNRKST